MKRWVGAVIVLAVSVLTTARGQQPVPPTPEYVPGEVLVKYRPIVQRGRRDAIAASRRGRLVRRFDQLDIDHLQLDPSDDVAATVAALRAMPEVAAAAPNYVRHAVQTQSPPPNDPKWLDGSLWGLVKIQAQNVWNTLNARGDGSVVIMDIDTGLNYNHQDLAANVWTNPGEIAGNGVDDDHDGYVDDIHGIDTVNHDSDPIDDNGHGTHTAGTIAAVGNNALGVVGVNWNAKILPCKFLSAGGSGTDSGAAECLNYAITLKMQHGVNIRVTNNSWGGDRNGGDFSVLLNAFAAAGNAGIINFVAAGNAGRNIDIAGNEFDPASLSKVEPSIVAVAASDGADNPAGFSNFGPNSVALAAPGVGIWSTYSPGNIYGQLSGTSMATPHVAGVAALLSSMDPGLNVMQLKALITGSVDVLPQWGGVVTTGGRLNAFAAASAVGGGPPTASQCRACFERRRGVGVVYDQRWVCSVGRDQRQPIGQSLGQRGRLERRHAGLVARLARGGLQRIEDDRRNRCLLGPGQLPGARHAHAADDVQSVRAHELRGAVLDGHHVAGRPGWRDKREQQGLAAGDVRSAVHAEDSDPRERGVEHLESHH